MWTRGLKLQHQRWASVLVLAEHDNKKLNPATHSLVTAGRKVFSDPHHSSLYSVCCYVFAVFFSWEM